MQCNFLNDDRSGLGIPYMDSTTLRGTPIKYLDLKRVPDLINQLPEIRGFTRLGSFLAKLNNKNSFFRSVRCEPWCKCQKGFPSARERVHWNFTLAFEIVAFNSRASYEHLRRQLCEYVSDMPASNLLEIDFRHIPTSFREHGMSGVTEDIEINGFGRTHSQARMNFIVGLELVERYFIERSHENLELLEAHGAITIS